MTLDGSGPFSVSAEFTTRMWTRCIGYSNLFPSLARGSQDSTSLLAGKTLLVSVISILSGEILVLLNVISKLRQNQISLVGILLRTWCDDTPHKLYAGIWLSKGKIHLGHSKEAYLQGNGGDLSGLNTSTKSITLVLTKVPTCHMFTGTIVKYEISSILSAVGIPTLYSMAE